MLDTDSVSYPIRGKGEVATRLVEHTPAALCVSAITDAELRFGAAKRKSAKLHRIIDEFLRMIRVMPFDDASAVHYAVISNDLARRGSPVGDFDVLIAAHAMALDLTLVTNNIKHFARVRGLKIENWL
jgi:tRNA(fMet)-specific endonuclease VapC